MEVTDLLLSASRAVLELVEREWQPLSAEELQLRGDRAAEDLLEAELFTRLEDPRPGSTQDLQREGHGGAEGTPAASGGESPPEAGEKQEAVKHISALLRSCHSRARMSGRARLSLSQTVHLSLTLLSERVSYRSVSRRFRLEKGNIHRIFYSFCRNVGTLKERLIRWPEGEAAVQALFPFCGVLGRAAPEDVGVPQVLGMLGHTRIPVRLPKGRRDVVADPDSCLNVELACDHRGRFVHCSISRASEASPGVALRDKLRLNPDLTPPGGCILAGAAYPLSAHILTPYTGRVGPREELFNRTLRAHLHILRQSMSHLKARFQRLRFLDVGSHERAVAVVLTSCVLHNVLLDIGQRGGGDVQEEGTGDETVEGEADDEGVRRRDAIADQLYRKTGQRHT